MSDRTAFTYCAFTSCNEKATAHVRIIGDKWMKLCGYHTYFAAPNRAQSLLHKFRSFFNRHIKRYYIRKVSTKTAKALAELFEYDYGHSSRNVINVTTSWKVRQGRKLNV